MRDYEVMYIVKPNFEEEQYTQIIEKYKALVQANGGEVVEVEPWGKRRLAYEIQKVANPILKRGDTSQTSIYYNEILKKFAVCENTFRSLVKLKEAENFPTLLAEYRNRQKARYQARLEHQRKKRIKQK